MLIQLASLLLLCHSSLGADSARSFSNTVDNIIRLRRSTHDLQTSSHALRASYLSNTTGLRSTGASFLAEITIGTSTFLSIVDTGSSDTWVVESNFTCVDVVTNATKPQSECYFGETYTADSQFQRIPNENLNIVYGGGEYLTGVFGTAPITLAGVHIPAQQVALATLAAWDGDGEASGIIGLAYPALTEAFSGSDPQLDKYCQPGTTIQGSGCNQVVYSSLVNTVFFQDRATLPQFALALSRDESNTGDGGYLSIGGLPSLDTIGVVDDEFASTPIQILSGDDRFRYYLIAIDGLVMLPAGSAQPAEKLAMERRTDYWPASLSRNDGHDYYTSRLPTSWFLPTTLSTTLPTTLMRVPRKSSSTDARTTTSTASLPIPQSSSYPITSGSAAEYIVDSGTTLSFFPSAMADAFNSMFSPPATKDSSLGIYFVQCDASTPSLGVKIGGTVFFHNLKDLVKQYDGTRCISGIQDSDQVGGMNILGDVFLDNVLAVFDLTQGNNRIWFASRMDYSS